MTYKFTDTASQLGEKRKRFHTGILSHKISKAICLEYYERTAHNYTVKHGKEGIFIIDNRHNWALINIELQ